MQSVFFRSQECTKGPTKSLERDWKRRVRLGRDFLLPHTYTAVQVAQARNMSIGITEQHSKYKDSYVEKTYRFSNLRKWEDFNKKQLTLPKMCLTSLQCGPRADLWPFYGFLCERFSLYKKTVHVKTHKTAMNRPVDHTGET